jgi:anaerobic magnesium-protoporphyrin IX monomethyl ester cyclase
LLVLKGPGVVYTVHSAESRGRGAMRILLIAMPDTADYIDHIIRIPNLALASLAGNLPGHDVRVLDLVACKPRLRKIITETLNSFRPQVVGLSAMSFQFATLLRVARFIRSLDARIALIAGGYHVTLMSGDETATQWTEILDFLVCGEGEATFRELLDALEKGRSGFTGILGLSHRAGRQWTHNGERPLQDLADIALPRRAARVAEGFYFGRWSMDVAETSRGCPFHCKFCSIMHMYGSTFRKFSLERIIADLTAIRARGTQSVFFVDDNITYDSDHFVDVCRAIVANGLQEMIFMTQVTAAGIADRPDLAAEMERANFRIAFVGFESMDPAALKGVHKPSSPEKNRRAAALLRKHHIAIVAGCVVGYPEDTWKSVTRQYQLMKSLRPDSIYAQYLTPYPKTKIREELLAESLITNKDDYTRYDGFTCNIRTRHMSEAALFRCLKTLTLRKVFDPEMIRVNAFRNVLPLSFVLASTMKCVLDNLYNIIFARRRVRRFDI